jgi:IS30 family transposase
MRELLFDYANDSTAYGVLKVYGGGEFPGVPSGSATPTRSKTIPSAGTEKLTIFTPIPAHAERSVTADNGSRFAHHCQLADTLEIPTYFADAYSAYQRGADEDLNGRIRRYLPNGTSFAELTHPELDKHITETSNRPHKILGWATPNEISRNHHRNETHRTMVDFTREPRTGQAS